LVAVLTCDVILCQVVFSADKPANTVEVALVLGPFGYSTHARIDRDD